MKFTINREEFLKGLQTAGHAISPKSSAPVLTQFKLDLTPRGLEIVASNNEISIWTLVPMNNGTNETIRNASFGSTLLNAYILTEIVRKIGSKEITVEVIDNTIAKIDDGKTAFKLNCISADQYPDIELAENAEAFELKCTDLIRLVEQTSFAALTKETRPILTGINLKADGGKLTATATDSARLSRKTVEVDPTLKFGCNIPSKVLVDLTHMLEGYDVVRVSPNKDKMIFAFGTTLYSSCLIGGDYPIASQIIPNTFNYYLEINADEFIRSVERVSILNVDRAPVVKLSMSEDSVEVSSRSDQMGSGNERLGTFQYTGERLEIAFNSQFVLDAVKAVRGEDVLLSFIGEMKPFVVKNPKDDSIIELVTPMRTR